MENLKMSDRALSKLKERDMSQEDQITRTADIATLEDLLGRFETEFSDKRYASFRTEHEKVRHMRKINGYLTSFLHEMGIRERRGIVPLILADTRALLVDRKEGVTFGAPSAGYALENLRRMLTLEKQAPGAVGYLHKRNGIKNFARFSSPFWLRQYTERTSPLPYMLVMISSGLEKAALTSTAVYTELQDSLKELSRPHLMRMVEVSTTPEALRILVNLNKRYNAHLDNPIATVLYDGHGNFDRLHLGGGQERRRFGNKDLVTERFKEVFRKYLPGAFSPTAQFVFGSCESAKHQDAVAYRLKETLQDIFSDRVRVVGSKGMVAAFSEISPSLRKDGSLTIKCESYTPREEHGEELLTTRFKEIRG